MNEGDVIFNPQIFERIHDISGCVRFLLKTDLKTFMKKVVSHRYISFKKKEWIDYIPHFHTATVEGGSVFVSMLDELSMNGMVIRYLGDGLAESFYTDVLGSELYYAIVHVRRCSDSFLTADGGNATYKWLKRKANKMWKRGGGVKEMVGVNIYDLAMSCKNLIPIGIEDVDDLVNSKGSHLVSLFALDYKSMAEHHDEEMNERDFNDYVIQRFIYIKSMEKSDTPTWITPSEDLCLMLLNTRLSLFDEDQFKLFSPAIFIELPKGFFRLHESDICAIGVYRSYSKSIQSGGDLYEGDLEDGISIQLYVDADRSHMTSLGAFMPMRFVCDFEKWTVTDKEKKTIGLLVCGREVSEQELTTFLFRFVINLVMYINSQGADMKKRTNQIRPKIKGARKKNSAQITLSEEFITGTSVKLSKEAREAMTRGASGWNITYSFLVRGHWRDQACGPGRSLRRKRWIEPYVKGKDLASRVLSHSYTDQPGKDKPEGDPDDQE